MSQELRDAAWGGLQSVSMPKFRQLERAKKSGTPIRYLFGCDSHIPSSTAIGTQLTGPSVTVVEWR